MLRWADGPYVSHIVAAACLAFVMAGPAQAGGGATGVVVGATVRPYARVVARSGPEMLEVAAEDVAHGFVEAPATVVTVRTNAPRGYVVRVERRGAPLFLVVEERGRGTALGPEGGPIVLNHVASPIDLVDLQWRFYLIEGVEPGTYPWPIRLSAAPRRQPSGEAARRNGSTNVKSHAPLITQRRRAGATTPSW